MRYILEMILVYMVGVVAVLLVASVVLWVVKNKEKRDPEKE